MPACIMPAPEQVLYAMPAMRALLRAEAGALCARLPARAGSYGLRLGMQEVAGECPDAVAHWVRLHLRGERWTGDVLAHGHEPLPFADDTYAIVWLSQVLQFHADSEHLLRDAVRVTAPGGLLALTGMHPFSAWAPWLSWCMRGSGRHMRLRMPVHLMSLMQATGLEVRGVTRFGQAWPRAATAGGTSSLLGGGYLLLARKRQDAVTPLRGLHPVRNTALQGSLAPGAHRECA